MKRRLNIAFNVLIIVVVMVSCNMIPSSFDVGMDVDVDTTSELGADTLERIDEINETIATGFEVGPETREVINELNETIRDGVKAGFDGETLARVDELLRVVEDGLEIGLDDETLAEVNHLVDTIDQMPGQWENTATDVIRVLETSGGTLAGRMADEVNSVIKEARVNAQQLSAAAGTEFRCNVDFLGSKAGASLSEFIGRSIVSRLKAIISGETPAENVPTPWVCQIIPETVDLSPAGGKLIFPTGVITMTGYNYVDANAPAAYVVDEAGQRVSGIQLFPYRTSPYQIQLNLQALDFSLVPPRARIVFQWPNVSETSAIAILMPAFAAPVAAFNASPLSGPAPLNVTFSDSSTGDPTAWQWSFGDGSTSNERSPVHMFIESGSFQVSLNASNSAGSSTIVQTINVGDQLAADFSFTPRKGDSPLAVNFQDRSTGNPSGWQWNFGDGGTSTERNPQHVYNTPRIEGYPVTLTITGTQGSVSKTSPDRVLVTRKPEARFNSDIRSGAPPQIVHFTDQSTGTITAWLWNFGDGSTSNEKNPTHTFTESKTYNITLTVTGVDGRQDTETLSGYIGLVVAIIPQVQMQFFAPFLMNAYYGAYALDGNQVLDTKISADKYVCGVSGYYAMTGDIEESGRGDILKAYMFKQYSSAARKNTWWLTADFRTHNRNERWSIDTFCIDRAAEDEVFTYREFRGIPGNDPFNTGLSTEEYVNCGVIGQAALDGDIEESGVRDVIWQAYMDGSGSEWKVFAEFATHNVNEKWNINTLCIKRDSYPAEEKPAVIFDTYYLSAVNHNLLATAVSPSEYWCGITGVSATSGDIEESGVRPILLQADLDHRARTWKILANFPTHNKEEDWRVDLLCINNKYMQEFPPPD